MAKDVLHHHCRIVDQDPDGEDEREETDPIDGVVDHPGPPDGEQDHHRDDRDDHEGRPRTQADQTEDGHDHRRLEHRPQQLVDLVVGAFTVVARDLDMDVRRDERRLQLLDLGKDLARDRHAVGPLFLRDRHGHGLCPVGAMLAPIGRPGEMADDLLGVLRDMLDRSDIAQIEWIVPAIADHQPTDILRIAQEGARIDVEGGIA